MQKSVALVMIAVAIICRVGGNYCCDSLLCCDYFVGHYCCSGTGCYGDCCNTDTNCCFSSPIYHFIFSVDNLNVECGSTSLPAVYTDYVYDALHRKIDDLAYNDKLSEIDKRVKQWEASVKHAIDEAVSGGHLTHY